MKPSKCLVSARAGPAAPAPHPYLPVEALQRRQGRVLLPRLHVRDDRLQVHAGAAACSDSASERDGALRAASTHR